MANLLGKTFSNRKNTFFPEIRNIVSLLYIDGCDDVDDAGAVHLAHTSLMLVVSLII